MSKARIDERREAQIHYRCGSSGSGKSWGVKEGIKKASRLMVFDPDDEYGKVESIVTVNNIRDLLSHIERYPKGALKIRLDAGGEKNFDLFCKIAFAWCNCTVVAEEIAGVTKPAKAPQGWHTLISRGRKRGIVIFAVTQRPAEADKTVLGNASTIRTGRLSRANDRKYLAAELDIEQSHINQLENLDFIECNMKTMATYKGRMGTRKRRTIR